MSRAATLVLDVIAIAFILLGGVVLAFFHDPLGLGLLLAGTSLGMAVHSKG